MDDPHPDRRNRNESPRESLSITVEFALLVIAIVGSVIWGIMSALGVA